MYQKFNGVSIHSITSTVPKEIVTNEKFSSFLSPKEIRIFEKTVGIKNRRWAKVGETASDLGYHASSSLLKNIDRKKIKSLIFLSQTSDYKIPFTSNILQNKLNLKKEILCLDINAGCAGFIQGLSTSFAIAQTLQENEFVLLIIAETLSKILDEKDRTTTPIFGDAASAILIQRTPLNYNESYFNFFSDGQNANAIMIPDGGYRNMFSSNSLKLKLDENSSPKSDKNLRMHGPQVFDFTLREIEPSIRSLIKESETKIENINKFLFHQSNKFIIKQIASKLNIDTSKVPINIQDFGNTSGVSIPLLMTTNKAELSDTKLVLCSGYGSGLTWGNCILDICKTNILPISESE